MNLTAYALNLSLLENGVYDIVILSVSGKKLFSSTYNTQEGKTLSFGNRVLSSGAYIVKISGLSGVGTSKQLVK